MQAGRLWLPAAALVALLGAAGCQTTYYRAMGAVGVHKRDLERSIAEANAFIDAMNA